MNHGNKVNHLGRTASHRKAMLSNMAASLILHKRITTTVAKAKELRKFVEPLITKAKDNTTHSRRVVFSALKYKEPVKELFGEVAVKVADRPGGYTRILKTGARLGDNADMCIIELVDYNETYTKGKKAPAKTRRKRSSGKKAAEDAEVVSETPAKKTKAPKAARAAEAAVVKDEEAPAAAPEVTEVPGVEQPEEGTPGGADGEESSENAETQNAE